MGEYQERPKRSSSNNNKNLPPIQAYEQYMYGGGYIEADWSPLPITPELIEQLEKEDEELFNRFASPEVSKNEQDIALSDERDKATSLGSEKLAPNTDKTEKAPIPVKKDSAPISVEKRDIANLTQAEKLGFVLILTIQKLPSALGSQLKALINPTSLAVMVGVIGAYAASHAVGVGFVADAVMGISAGLFLGWQAVDVAKDLWAFAQYVNATTESELDKAAEYLAKAITTVGFDVILGILTKKAAGKVSKHVDELKQVDEPGTITKDLVEPGGKNNPNPNNGTMRSIENVNPGYPKSGRTLNCVNCSVATDATLKGNPAQALPGKRTPIVVLEKQYSAKFLKVGSKQRIIQEFKLAGNGKKGIVYGVFPDGNGHVFNVINQDGIVRFLDGQNGKPAEDFAPYVQLYIMPTN